MIGHSVLPAGGRHPCGFAGERGETLIELMATIVLMGIAIVALVTSLLGAMSLTRFQSRNVNAASGTIVAAESIRTAPYVACAPVGSYDAALPTVRGLSLQVESIAYLHDQSAAAASWDNGCPAADQGAQQITVKATANGNTNVSKTLTFVKRNTTCPGTGTTTVQGC